jgi:quercetin dioxygenase-like cupin family protein
MLGARPAAVTERRLTGAVGTRLLYEDDITRVWLLDLAPGEATEWHEHDCDYIFVVTRAGPVRCEYVNGSVEHQAGETGTAAYRSRDLGHRLVNTGDGRYQNIVVELKQTSTVPPSSD